MIIHPELSRATHYITDTGDRIKWTHMTKHLYAHMLNRNWFFTKKLKGSHFESQKVIAESIASDYQVVGRNLRLFRDHGLIDFKTESIKGSVQKRCVYTKVESKLTLVKLDGEVYTIDLIKDDKKSEISFEDIDGYYGVQFEL